MLLILIYEVTSISRFMKINFESTYRDYKLVEKFDNSYITWIYEL
jgi:hypothetical protein